MERPIFPTTQKEAKKSGKAYSSADNKAAIFPTQLRELRAKKGISQEGLSKVLGVSKSTLGLWENGDTLPDAKSLRDLAVYFQVSADYILGLARVKSPNQRVQMICDYLDISEDAVQILHEEKNKFAQWTDHSPFNCFLGKLICNERFHSLLWHMMQFKGAKEAEVIFEHIIDSMPPEAERKDLISAIGKALEESNIPLEVRETLQAFQLLETGDMGLFQPFEDYETGYFRPAELYEYRVTKILIELLNEITKQEK